MGQLNLYKIDSSKQKVFEDDIVEKYELIGNELIKERFIVSNKQSFRLRFFINVPDEDNNVEWNWLARVFDRDCEMTTRSNPRGILVIDFLGNKYACTYGFSFFSVDKYCDTGFAFNFARRMKYKEVKTTTLFSPNLKRNKSINTYLNYSELEFDSGEAFAKLKVNADLPDEFEIFDVGFEAGHSIKFSIPNNSVEAILDVLIYVLDKMNHKEIYKIPVFNKITDKAKIELLNTRLETNIENVPGLINFSELDIIGVAEIFNRNNSSFELKRIHAKETIAEIYCPP